MVHTPKTNKSLKKNTPISRISNGSQEILNFDNPKPTIKSLSSLMKVLHESQNYLSKENDEFRARIDCLEAENKILLMKNETAEKSIKNLSNEIKQEKLENHFNINGLPQLTKDQSIDVVLKIANELEINLTKSDIKDIQYFNNKKTNKHDYIFELKNKELKKEFIYKRKSKLIFVNNNLDIFSVNSNSTTINKNNSRIFINDHLSKFNHYLFNHAKSLKNCNYKYIWYKFGKIFVKKDDNSEVINVRSYQTIDNLIHKFEIPAN